MKIRFYPESVEEFEVAASYYESIYNKLSLDFISEVKAEIKRILENPTLLPIHKDDTRKILLSKFPYYIVYLIDNNNDTVWIIAISHNKRLPEYWKQRIKR